MLVVLVVCLVCSSVLGDHVTSQEPITVADIPFALPTDAVSHTDGKTEAMKETSSKTSTAVETTKPSPKPEEHVEMVIAAERLKKDSGASLRNSSSALETAAKHVLLSSLKEADSLKKELATLAGVDVSRWIRPRMRATIARHQKKCGSGGKCKIGTGLRRYIGLPRRQLLNESFAVPDTERVLSSAVKAVRENLEKIRLQFLTTTMSSRLTTNTMTTAPAQLIQLSDDDIVQAVLKTHASTPKKSLHSHAVETRAELRHEAIEKAALKAAAEAARLFDLKQKQ